MVTHNKKSAELWNKNQDKFLELHKKCPYNDFYTKMTALSKKYDFYASSGFSEEGTLRIYIEDVPKEFFNVIEGTNFLEYRKLELKRLSIPDPQYQVILINFLEKANHERLDFFSIFGDMDRMR